MSRPAQPDAAQPDGTVEAGPLELNAISWRLLAACRTWPLSPERVAQNLRVGLGCAASSTLDLDWSAPPDPSSQLTEALLEGLTERRLLRRSGEEPRRYLLSRTGRALLERWGEPGPYRPSRTEGAPWAGRWQCGRPRATTEAIRLGTNWQTLLEEEARIDRWVSEQIHGVRDLNETPPAAPRRRRKAA